MEETAPIRSYSQKELRALYGSYNRSISWVTWNSWTMPIKTEIGNLKGGRYSIKQVEIIFKHLGTPYINAPNE